MSAVERGPGGYKIDPAELFRVFPKPSETGSTTVAANDQQPHENRAETGAYTEILKAQIDGLTSLLTEKERRITDLETDRDRWAEQAARLALTHQTAASQPARPAPQTALQRLLGFFRTQTPPQT